MLVDLRGKFASRSEDQRASGPPLFPDEPMHDRQQKGGSFPAPGRSRRKDVATSDRGRHRVVLDGSGPREPKLFDSAQKIRVKSEC